MLDTLEGADAGALTAKAQQHLGASAPPPPSAAAVAAAPAAASASPATLARIKGLLAEQPVMLFMKGVPEAPRCGFSRRVVESLRAAGVAFGSFDILSDEGVRQGLKEVANWPTYPQLFVRGELLGGCDIITEMASAGELRATVDEMLAAAAAAPAPAPAADLQARVKALVHSHDVMLFMKGEPEAPRCGFSGQVVGALRAAGVAFGSFDILSDDGVRQGLKEYANWPTYPQLYVKGELLGGCDIVMEAAAGGELRTTVDEMLHRMQDAS